MASLSIVNTLSHTLRRIRERGWSGRLRRDMFPDGRIAHPISPVDEPFLNCRRNLLQASGLKRQQHGFLAWAMERVGQIIILNMRPDAPVRAEPVARFVGIDYLVLAQAAHLIIDDIQDAKRVTRPIGMR